MVTAILLAGLGLQSGCRTTHRLELTPSGSPAFKRFVADYEIPDPSSHLLRSFTESAAVSNSNDHPSRSVRLTGGTQRSVSTGLAAAHLTIECPHPSGSTTEALVTVSVTPDSRMEAAGSQPPLVRRLSVPRQQVELLIFDLARAGFFDGDESRAATSRLSVSIDGARVTRAWRSDERLLDFAHRTFHTGSAAAD